MWLIATDDSGCGIARDVQPLDRLRGRNWYHHSRMAISILVYHAIADDFVCEQTVPCAVRLLYDLGVLALFVTLARSQFSE